VEDPFDAATAARLMNLPNSPEWEAVGPDWIYAPGPCWVCLVERLRRNGWVSPKRRSHPPADGPRAGNLLTWQPRREHAVVPFPSCPRCRDHPGFAGSEEWTSPLTGIVRSVAVEEAWRGFFVAWAELSQSVYPLLDGRWFRGARQQVSAHGPTAELARQICLYEAAERYSLQWHADEELVVARFSDIRRRALNPREYLHYSDRQYANRDDWRRYHGSFQWVPEPFDPGAVMHWTTVRRMHGRAERLVPASLCFLGVPDRFVSASTNGCAAGSTRARAALCALYELVERDAVSLWWYNRGRRPSIRVNHSVKAILERENRRFWTLDLTHDLGIPVAVAVSCDSDGGRIVMGSAAGETIGVAAEKAASEMLMIYHGLLCSNDEARNQITNSGALQQWFREERLGPRTYLTPGRGARLPAVVSAEQKLDGWIKWHTRRDIGVEVARVIVPELRHWWARFAPGRLYDVPPAIGWTRRVLCEQELNPEPFLL